MNNRFFQILLFACLISIFTGVQSVEAGCGNSIVEKALGEDCDNGTQNSDTEPDACRSSCQKASCGDGVADSWEQCDGDDNKGTICSDFKRHGENYWSGSLSCNYECTLDLSECHYCGDGITQAANEQCDDGNNSNDDGCNTNCTVCLPMTDNLENIISDTEICTADYDADDYGDLGAIIIKHPNVTLDCDYARLTGQGDGIGIYIKRSDNVTVKNCLIDNYKFGIYAEDSDNIQVRGMGNRMFNTTEMLVLDNSTALPPPDMAVQQKLNPGLSKNRQDLMGQKLQIRKVPSKVGDNLKMKARPDAIVPPAGSSRVARVPVKREAERVRQPRPERVRPPAAPLITFPKSGQRFTAPANITVQALHDMKRKVTYSLKQLPGKRIVKKSTRGTFSKLLVGNYCVTAAYTGRGGTSSACIEFRVEKPNGITAPVRQSVPLRRP